MPDCGDHPMVKVVISGETCQSAQMFNSRHTELEIILHPFMDERPLSIVAYLCDRIGSVDPEAPFIELKRAQKIPKDQ
jgi:hypothetical protein